MKQEKRREVKKIMKEISLARLSVTLIKCQIIGLSTDKGSKRRLSILTEVVEISSLLHIICPICLKVFNRFKSYQETTSFETVHSECFYRVCF